MKTFAILISLAAAAGGGPETYVLRVPEHAWDVAVEDLDGDGRGEVLVLCCDETCYPLKKAVYGFAASEDGSYPEEAGLVLPLDPATSTLFFAETDGTGPRELVAAHSAGATVFSYTEGGFQPTRETAFVSLLPSNAREPIFAKKMAEDLDNDGIDEWLIPMPTGFAIRHGDELVASIACDVTSEIRREGSTYIFHRLPALSTFDLPGEAQKGLAFLSDEFADFACGPDWARKERFRIPLNLEEKWEASAQMGDVNNDGFPDLMVNQTKGTINIQSLTQVYVAEKPFVFPEEPTATFLDRRVIADPRLKDVNGDGCADAMLLTVPLGVKNILNFFVRGKLAVQVAVHLWEDGAFSKKPSYKTSLTMDAPEGRERVAYTMGDYNADGRLDVAFGKADNTLVVHTGEEKNFVSSRAWVKLALPSFGVGRSCDANGNEADDIVIHHPGGQNSTRVELVVF